MGGGTPPAAARGSTVQGFTLAEDYHQKYALRADRPTMKQMRAYYPGDDELRESTAAARLNGYLYGAGSPLQLEREIDGLGLMPRGTGGSHSTSASDHASSTHDERGDTMSDRVEKTDDEWRAQLTQDQFRVLRRAATDLPSPAIHGP